MEVDPHPTGTRMRPSSLSAAPHAPLPDNQVVCLLAYIPAPALGSFWPAVRASFRCWHAATHCPLWLQCPWGSCIPSYSWLVIDRSCIVHQHGLVLRSLTSQPAGMSGARWLRVRVCQLREGAEEKTDRGSPTLMERDRGWAHLRSQHCALWIPWCSFHQRRPGQQRYWAMWAICPSRQKGWIKGR